MPSVNINIPFPYSEQLQLCISFSNKIITGIDFVTFPFQRLRVSSPGRREDVEAPLAKKIQQEFSHYFLNPGYTFSLSCQLDLGTPFQQKVWQALIRIPAGQVKTYGSLAKEINSSARAVGNACRRNRFPIIVPCHRVVSASGIGGYAGDTLSEQKGNINYLQIKQRLLAHEKANFE